MQSQITVQERKNNCVQFKTILEIGDNGKLIGIKQYGKAKDFKRK